MTVLFYGAFEPAEVAAAAALTRRPGVAIDVGANVGIFSLAMARAMGPKGEVWAVEPMPSNVEQLSHNIALAAGLRIEIFPLALSDTEGDLLFYSGVDGTAASTTRTNKHSGDPVQIRSIQLDTIWRQRHMPKVSFVKIDVEYAELEVLKGAKQVLTSCRPAILLETFNLGEVLDLLPTGYSCSHPKGFSPQNHLLLPTKPD